MAETKGVCDRSSINEKKIRHSSSFNWGDETISSLFLVYCPNRVNSFCLALNEKWSQVRYVVDVVVFYCLHISYSYTGQAITNSLTMICFVFFFFRRPGVSNTGGKPAGFTFSFLGSASETAKSIFNLGKTDESARPWIRRDMIWQFSIFIWHRVRFFGCFSPISQFKLEANLVTFFQKFAW